MLARLERRSPSEDTAASSPCGKGQEKATQGFQPTPILQAQTPELGVSETDWSPQIQPPPGLALIFLLLSLSSSPHYTPGTSPRWLLGDIRGSV